MDKRRDSHPRTGSATGGASPSDERAPTAPAAGAAAVSAEPGDGVPQERSPAGEEGAGRAPSAPRAARLRGPVYVADRTVTTTRRREDLVEVAVCALGIVAVWALGVVASATTRGVTMDVMQFQVIRRILLLPVNLIEGMIVLTTPIAVVSSLALRRRLRSITQALATSVGAAIGGMALSSLARLLPESLAAPLSVDRAIATQGTLSGVVIGVNILFVVLAALFTASGEAQSMRSVRWGWAGLWAIVFLSVMRSSVTLPGAFVSVLIGRAFGCAGRWGFGFGGQRARGREIVRALLDIGIVPTHIVRTDLDTTTEPLRTWSVSEDEDGSLRSEATCPGNIDIAVTLRPDSGHNRHYQVWDAGGRGLELVVVEPGRELTGTLVELWNNFRLRGISRWVSPSAKANVERAALTSLQASRAGVRTQEHVGITAAGDSIIVVMEALEPTAPLTELGGALADALLDEAWAQLAAAHTRGITHRNLAPNSVVVDTDGRVWLLDWDRGEVATTDLNRSIDVAQMLVLQALAAGPERALASGRRCVGDEALAACAPLIQKPVLPTAVNQRLRRSDLLGELRGALVEDSEAEEAGTANIQRFQPRTVFTFAILFVAVFVVLGSLNFSDIISALAQANPWWILASALLACLIWVGASVPLMALSPERLRFSDTLIAQVAASIITIVAPAGVGPAALNLRYLRKKRVPTAMAVTTVTLMQLSQVLITVTLLLLVVVVSGASLSVSIPYGTILAVVGVVVAVVGAVLAVPRARAWVWSKVEPTWQQVYPRLLWIVGQPRRLALVVCGNLLMNIGYVGAFWSALTAMGGSLEFSNVALTYLTSNALGSVIPSPGGIGPVETALTAGLQVAGVSVSIGLPTAIIYRLVTFYGRIPFGWVAMKYMERKDLI